MAANGREVGHGVGQGDLEGQLIDGLEARELVGVTGVEPGATGWSVDSAHPELWFDYVKGISRERLAAMGEAAGRKIRSWTPAAFADAVERAIPRKNR